MPVSSIPPHQTGTPVLDAHVVDAPRLEVAADAAGLDVHDRCTRRAAIACGRDARRHDRLVQADRRCARAGASSAWPSRSSSGQRLLDEQQVERVELGEVRGVVEGVGGVRVDLERDVAEALAHRAHRLDVAAGLDLQLDPPVALGEVPLDRAQQVGDVVVDPDGHAAVDALA